MKSTTLNKLISPENIEQPMKISNFQIFYLITYISSFILPCNENSSPILVEFDDRSAGKCSLVLVKANQIQVNYMKRYFFLTP